MKKLRLFIIVVILFIVKSTYAQNEITGFLGVKFGDTNYVAIDILKKKFPQLEYNFPYINIPQISFLGTTFDSLVITFKEGKLVEGTFSLSETTSALLNEYPFRTQEQTQDTIKNKQEYIVNKYTQLFNDIGNTFVIKYGKPQFPSEGTAIWRDNKLNSIKINSSIESRNGSNIIYFDGKLAITYQVGMSTDEF